MILVLLGPPGSGKGTQAKMLTDLMQAPQISTGDMLRLAAARNTDVGQRAKSYMENGSLVPDDVVVGLVADRITDSDCVGGFLLDGFPRTVSQAAALSTALDSSGRTLDNVLFLDVEDEELLIRITGRRSCPSCGMIYHLQFNPPQVSDKCSCGHEGLVQRSDDNENTVRSRLATYHTQTSPLIDYYRELGLLRKISGTGQTPLTVLGQIKSELGL